MASKKRVSYFYDQNIGTFHYAGNHPMKPFRIRMTDSLVAGYGLYKNIRVHRPTPASFEQMTKFHTDDYIRFLQRVSPDLISNEQLILPTSSSSSSSLLTTLTNITTTSASLLTATVSNSSSSSFSRIDDRKFNFGDDCPPFEGIYDFSALSAGGSIDGAARLAGGSCDIAINWGGGLHHAKKTEASGFCYVNDIVLAILELLKTFKRVLYVDVDVHHGDGVEEAFYTTDRVMTVSFHLFGNGFFPGTGSQKDTGVGKGLNYAVNVPLMYGIDDESYKTVFQNTIQHVMAWYRPSVVVLQLGADSLAGDRLGMFNLSMRGHASCVEIMRRYNVPLLMLGGGGYTIRNVARTWTYETAVAAGVEISDDLPYTEFMEYYGPEYKLDVPATNITNTNTREYIEKLQTDIVERLRNMPFAPSVQGFDDVPNDKEYLTNK